MTPEHYNNLCKKFKSTYKIPTILEKVFTLVYTLNEEVLVLENEDGAFVFFHSQECCEHVYIADIVGDLSDLMNAPIKFYDESSSKEGDSTTWTFYKFGTQKGWVDVRWCGTSNGYYSEKVNIFYIDKRNKID